MLKHTDKVSLLTVWSIADWLKRCSTPAGNGADTVTMRQ
jgi:hypothetical protein